MTREEMIERIDVVANAQRARMVGDPVKVFEYVEAEKGAVAYRDAGFAGQVPAVVQSWADARAWTPRQAAEDILMEAVMFHMALNIIRGVRLQAKYALADAAEDRLQGIYDNAIETLKGIG